MDVAQTRYRNYELRVLGQDAVVDLDDYRGMALEDPGEPWWVAA